LKGPVTTPIGGGFSSINVALRKQFELFANFRPIRNLPAVPTRYPGVDLIVVRENTEGLYSGIEHEVVPGVVESLKIITEKASTRIARFAFEYARRCRKKIHAIHKANIMKLSDGLFIRCSRDVLQGLSRDHLRRAHCRQHLHAAGHESLSVRHAAAGEPLRRHHLRSVRGLRRRTGTWFPAPTSDTNAPSSKRSTAPPLTSRAKTSPILRPCCAREF
jgi:isocitrate dehydrogenase